MATGQQSKQANQGAREYKAYPHHQSGQELLERLQQQIQQHNCDGDGVSARNSAITACEQDLLKISDQLFETELEEEDDVEDSVGDSDTTEDLVDEATLCLTQHSGRLATNTYQQQQPMAQISCFKQQGHLPNIGVSAQGHVMGSEDALDVYTIPEEADEESAGLSGVALAADLDVLNSDTAQSLLRWRGRPKRPGLRTFKPDPDMIVLKIIRTRNVRKSGALLRRCAFVCRCRTHTSPPMKARRSRDHLARSPNETLT